MPVSNISNELPLQDSDVKVENSQTINIEDTVGSSNANSFDNTFPIPDHNAGMTAEELNNPNKIKVTVTDTQVPLVVLYGPPSSGKTMTLVRLARFLRTHGYQILPVKTFRPNYDSNYAAICNDFNYLIASDNAAESTSNISFMLVEVLDNRGKRICQILEAPGEYYFNPKKPNAGMSSYPRYVKEIFSLTSLKKIFTIIVEPGWLDKSDRDNYVVNIAKLPRNHKDKIIFLYNKIDTTPFMNADNHINYTAALKQMKLEYLNILSPFENKNPITKLWKSYNCDFVPFMTGLYTDTGDSFAYSEGSDDYCVKLWNSIKKCIMG